MPDALRSRSSRAIDTERFDMPVLIMATLVIYCDLPACSTLYVMQEASNTKIGSSLISYTVVNWQSVLPVIQDFESKQRSDGSVMSKWTWSKSNQIVLRSSFGDLDSMISNINDQLKPMMDAMLQGGAVLNRVDLHSPSSEWLPRIRAASENFPCVSYFETPDGMASGCFSKTGTDMPPIVSETYCSSHPVFNVLSWESAKPIVDEFIIYFGWSMKSSILQWQAHFTNGDALRYHLQNTRGLYDSLVEGPGRSADLERFELHGSRNELEKCRGIAQGLDPVYFWTDELFCTITQLE